MPLLFLEPVSPKSTKAEILALLTHTGGIARQHIGAIELRGATAAIEVPARWQLRLVQSLQGATLNSRRLRVWTDGSAAHGGSAHDHFERLLRLMEREAEAEAEQAQQACARLTVAEAEASGRALVDLVVTDM